MTGSLKDVSHLISIAVAPIFLLTADGHGLRRPSLAIQLGGPGRLFVVEADYQVVEPAPPFAAVGGGAPYALGSLATSRGSPVARIKTALSVAERFCIGVRAPFRIVAVP